MTAKHATTGPHGLEGASRRVGGRKVNVLKVGIASPDEVKARVLAIARGELRPAPGDPRVWFPSAETFGKVMSGSNRELLAQIRTHRPASLKELAELTGRQQSNLSRTLKTMERYGLVTLSKAAQGRVVPAVPYDKVDVSVSIARAADARTGRREKADWQEFDRIMMRDSGEPPREGDEIPDGLDRRRARDR